MPAQLVPGDIIRLEAGDFIPADARLLKSVSLKSEESCPHWRVRPRGKGRRRSGVAENAPLGDRANMVFSGCCVTYGTATAVVTGTGMHTEMGKIAGLLERRRAKPRRPSRRSWPSWANTWACWP